MVQKDGPDLRVAPHSLTLPMAVHCSRTKHCIPFIWFVVNHYIYIVYPCVTIIPFILSGWWFGTFFPYIGNVIIPTDELIFFRWVQTTKQILLVVNHHICPNHLSFPQRGLSRAAGGGARVLRRWGACGVVCWWNRDQRDKEGVYQWFNGILIYFDRILMGF